MNQSKEKAHEVKLEEKQVQASEFSPSGVSHGTPNSLNKKF